MTIRAVGAQLFRGQTERQTLQTDEANSCFS